MVKFGMRVRTWDSIPLAKVYKNRLRGYTLFGQIILKITNFRDFGAIGPHFKSENG